ncbi:tRNA lysidine(34) synthetase TilS [Campylobacterota bacterium]
MSLLPFEKLQDLQGKKPLLAFSGGADSTALFFTLIEYKIPFDIAIVHYGLRPQADEEVQYAKELCLRFSCNCHLLKAQKIEQNFEYEARKIRYDFFERLIREHNYTHLLTAHHLQDRLEWMLMQLSKGAGSAELLGMQEEELRPDHSIRRPLINSSKDEILSYLRDNKLHWFYDESNDDLSYKRNYFRHKIVNELLKDNIEGIKQSFKYLQEDVSELIKKVKIHEAEELSLFFATGHKRSDIFHIDKILKSKGYILTAQQREELKTKDEIIAGRRFLVVLDKGIYYIAPYLKEVMDKEFKEECRALGVPNKLRPYLFVAPLAFILFTRFLPCNVNMHSK